MKEIPQLIIYKLSYLLTSFPHDFFFGEIPVIVSQANKFCIRFDYVFLKIIFHSAC